MQMLRLVYIEYPLQRLTWNLGFVLNHSPYFKKKKGMGMQAAAMKPSNEAPQPYPSALYMDGPARGIMAAKADRRTVLAAMADAACTVNTSTR
jgi:hypothetical protein